MDGSLPFSDLPHIQNPLVTKTESRMILGHVTSKSSAQSELLSTERTSIVVLAFVLNVLSEPLMNEACEVREGRLSLFHRLSQANHVLFFDLNELSKLRCHGDIEIGIIIHDPSHCVLETLTDLSQLIKSLQAFSCPLVAYNHISGCRWCIFPLHFFL